MASRAFPHAEERPQGASRSTHNRNATDAFRMLFRVGMKWSRHMQKAIGFVWIVGSFGCVAAANAQTASPPAASTQFDGTYGFVSATKLTETYATRGSHRVGQCGDYTGRPLTIANGQARYPGRGRLTAAGFEGTVGPQGELAMRLAATPATRGAGASPGVEIIINGKIDSNGAVHARQMSYGCSYDLIWQKQSR